MGEFCCAIHYVWFWVYGDAKNFLGQHCRIWNAFSDRNNMLSNSSNIFLEKPSLWTIHIQNRALFYLPFLLVLLCSWHGRENLYLVFCGVSQSMGLK